MIDREPPMDKSEELDTPGEKADRDPIEKIGRANFQAVLNILTESPFFYAADDPMRFSCLRRNESLFRKFIDKYFGWRLYVDPKMARLIKDQNFNPALRPVHRSYFRLNSRNECLLFLILLEFYEHECTAQAYSHDDLNPLNFTYADLLSFAKKAFTEHLGDKSPTEREVDASARHLLKKMQQYRLLRVIDVDEKSIESDFRNMLIEVLPGLSCYEGRKMSEAVVKQEFSVDENAAFSEVAEGEDPDYVEETEEENGENL